MCEIYADGMCAAKIQDGETSPLPSFSQKRKKKKRSLVNARKCIFSPAQLMLLAA